MKASNQLVIFPQNYPHKGGDQVFVANEIVTLSLHFKKITIIHFRNLETPKIEVPRNVEIKYLTQDNFKPKLIGVIDIVLIKILLSELKRTSFKVWLKYFRYYVSSFLSAKAKIKTLIQNNLFQPSSKYYSFWMNENSFLLAICKKRKLIDNFFFRLHGFDLYDEIRPDKYIPFRDFNFSQVTKAFTVSKYGLNYLKPKLKNPNKLENSYLGTFDKGFNPFDSKENILVSCSSINKQKRVNLIADALCEIKDIKIRWIHIGDKGDWGTYIDLEKYAQRKLPSNVSFKAKGYMSNKDILNFYRTSSISAFVHLSETEGGPSIACIEAISFGIPLIAAPNGGLRETINPKTGIVLEKTISKQYVAIAIKNILSEKYQNIRFRSGIKKYWNNTFEAERNNLNFIQKIKN